MVKFTSVFRDPIKGVFANSMSGATLEKEIANAKRLGEHYGEYLYSRPVRQVLMRSGERYAFGFYDNAYYLKYRKHDEAWFGSFDYYQSDDNYRTIVLTLAHSVSIPECGMNADVKIDVRFDYPRAIQFRDLCKEHFVAIEFSDGQAFMCFYKTAHTFYCELKLALPILPQRFIF